MTYLQVHLLFVVPPLLALLAAHRLVPAAAPRRLGVALAAMVGIALVYTTPWDNYLVARGVWSYPPGRVWFALGYVALWFTQPIFGQQDDPYFKRVTAGLKLLIYFHYDLIKSSINTPT
ncbi:MAG: lycopene cyclase domain-containing protein [Deinococcales bacterium]